MYIIAKPPMVVFNSIIGGIFLLSVFYGLVHLCGCLLIFTLLSAVVDSVIVSIDKVGYKYKLISLILKVF